MSGEGDDESSEELVIHHGAPPPHVEGEVPEGDVHKSNVPQLTW